MVDIYKAQRGEIRNESHFTLPGDIEFVLASDYAALEAELKDVRLAVVRLKMGFDHIQAERDELKRRCEATVKMLDDCGTQMVRFEKYGGAQSKFAHGVYEHACLIAEGRDNG